METAIQHSDFLKKRRLFDGLSEETFLAFLKEASIKRIKKGSVLFVQGDNASCFYVVLEGWVKLFRETMSGDEAIVDVLSQGSIFGETAVFEEGKYPYGAEVVEDTKLLLIALPVLKNEIESNHRLALNMLSAMSQHRRQQEKEIEHLSVQNAPQRIGCFLLRLCPAPERMPVTLHLPYDKSLIASRLGMKPETFSRALAKLKGETGIEVNGPAVKIDSIEQLTDYCCGFCSDSFPCEDIKTSSF